MLRLLLQKQSRRASMCFVMTQKTNVRPMPSPFRVRQYDHFNFFIKPPLHFGDVAVLLLKNFDKKILYDNFLLRKLSNVQKSKHQTWRVLHEHTTELFVLIFDNGDGKKPTGGRLRMMAKPYSF